MMNVYWIWLTLVKGLGPVTQKTLLQHFGTPEHIFNAGESELQKVPRLHKNVIEQIRNQCYLEEAKRIEEQLQAQKVKTLTYNDPAYPDQVKEVRDFPVLLYYRAKLNLQPSGVGIVGSRRCTSYGKQVATEAAEYLVQHKIPVISGMAKGIDGYAHTACAKSGGYTVAFVAHGIDLCYPPEQKSLMETIIDVGAVITEYPPGTRPRQEYFPRRNALISAWLDKLLVVEAAERSGALITAQMAQKLNKEVYAVPNNIYSEESKGTNRLIRDGANIYLSREQLLPNQVVNYSEEPGLKRYKRNEQNLKTPIQGEVQKKIYERLESPKRTEELLDVAEGDFAMLLDLLFKMELDGIIKILPGNLISRSL